MNLIGQLHDACPGIARHGVRRAGLIILGTAIAACSAPCAAQCSGDVDRDCRVELSDLAAVLQNFGCMNPSGCVGDVDLDRDVDLTDLSRLLGDFGRDCRPAGPTGLRAGDVTATSVTVCWNYGSGAATQFVLLRRLQEAGAPNDPNAPGGEWMTVATAPGAERCAVDAHAEAETAYVYVVYAVVGGCQSPHSQPLPVETPAPCTAPMPPSGLHATLVGETSATICWTAPAQPVTAHAVYRLGEDDPNDPNDGWRLVGDAAPGSPCFSDSGLQPSTMYSYRVVAQFESCESAPSAPLTVTTASCAPASPAALRPEDVSDTSLRLLWSDNSGNEDGFFVYRLDAEPSDPNEPTDPNQPVGEWFVLETLPANHTVFVDSELDPLTTYRYRLTAFRGDCESAPSNEISVTTGECQPPAAPANLALADDAGGAITFCWQDQANNETAYRVARLDPGEDPSDPRDWDNVSGNLPPNTTCFTDTHVSPGACYQYKVRARGECGYSAYSNITSRAPLGPVGLQATIIQANLVRLCWQDQADNETEYRVARLDPGENPANPAAWDNVSQDLPPDTTCWTDSSVQPESCYRYKVRAANDCGYSAYSNDISVCTPSCRPAQPGNLRVTGTTAGSVSICWDDLANNENAYRVARLDPGEDPGNPAAWDNVSQDLPPNTTCWTDSSVQSESCYRYKVRAANDCGYSSYSNEATACTPSCRPAAPDGLLATGATPSSITICWADRSANETEFRVARLDPGEDPGNPAAWDNVGVVSANQTCFTDATVCSGRTYQYKVRAANGCGYSDYSNVVVIGSPGLSVAPANFDAARTQTTPNADPVRCTWTYNGPPVSGFRVARLGPGGDPNNPNADWQNVSGDITPGSRREWTDTPEDLQNGRTYYYKIRAFLATPCGDRVYSDYSNFDGANP